MNRVRVAIIAATIAAVVVTPSHVEARPSRPPRTLGTYAGLSVAAWSAHWWQWAAVLPAAISPITDTDGRHCALGRLGGPVFFLAGTTGTVAERWCTIPANKPILIPAISVECSYVPSADPEDCGTGPTYDTLRADAHSFLTGPLGVRASVTVDGTLLVATEAISSAPPFTIVWAPTNPFGVGASIEPAVADGYWVLLAPLDPGHHDLVIDGEVPDLRFAVKVTYHLTIRR
jgi:hypothetical protein